ncbi:MAG: DNA primase [Flavobacteriales bacterium]|nr:DNA primase [Flavobacteriales bacterium]
MLTPDSIEKIRQAARVEEVVGDFVTLKRRGSNLIGRCPFHDEKTPSFTVNPARGIFKCFGCGKAGDSIKFVMEHEHFSYPEALKFIARKYNIEIEEREVTPEEKQAENERESLFAVNEFARNYFRQTLHETEEGQVIGLSYYKERGFSADTIQKFQLGYSPESYDAFLKAAEEKGYKPEYLIKLGLIKENDKGNRYDAYRGRVIFPIHNISGRVIGFGGRVLKKTETAPKYINSPQNEIYDKSKTLYGIYFAKESIIKNDVCYLVEGYTDVISLYQSGIKNVVASSGTSLTPDQIKQIRRFTDNVTILYDGDTAGIKASFRGIDMFLEQGINVRVLLFPDGEDPDSFARKTPVDELQQYLNDNTRDFIGFKTDVLIKEAGKDPVKRAEIVRDAVTSIALIPDPIKRSVFVRECSVLFEMEEAMLMAELNKILRSRKLKNLSDEDRASMPQEAETAKRQSEMETEASEKETGKPNLKETDLIRLLIQQGAKKVHATYKDEEGEVHSIEVRVADIIISELRQEAFNFETEIYNQILTLIENHNLEAEEWESFEDVLIGNPDQAIQETVINITLSPHRTSDRWAEYNVSIKNETETLHHKVVQTINSLKIGRVDQFIREKMELLKAGNEEESTQALEEIKLWEDVRRQISNLLGRVILK